MKPSAFLCIPLCALCVASEAEPIEQQAYNSKRPAPQIVLELPPGPGNPRNSEGTFATLRDGRILYAYTRFSTEIRDGIPDSGAAEIVARYSSDGGLSWTTNDTTVIANEGAFNVCCPSLLRLQSGELALFYLRKNSQSDCIPMMRRSFDEGATWGEPTKCITDAPGYYVLNNDRVIQLRDGRLLFAVSLLSAPDGSWDEKGTVLSYYSDDNGATWRRGGTVAAVSPMNSTSEYTEHTEGATRTVSQAGGSGGRARVTFQEPGVVELRDGRILLWIRTDAGCLYVCHSSDRGETWTVPRPSPFVSPLSPASIKRLPTGDLLALWNDHASRPEMKTRGPAWAHGARTPLAAVLSRDDGETWSAARLLEDAPDGWFCYTSVHPLADGTVLLGYCAFKELAHSRIVKVPMAWF